MRSKNEIGKTTTTLRRIGSTVASGGRTRNKSIKLSLTQKAMRALAEAVAEVVEDHRRRGKPLAVWRDGKAVWVPAPEAGALHETPSPYRTKSSGRKT